MVVETIPKIVSPSLLLYPFSLVGNGYSIPVDQPILATILPASIRLWLRYNGYRRSRTGCCHSPYFGLKIMKKLDLLKALGRFKDDDEVFVYDPRTNRCAPTESVCEPFPEDPKGIILYLKDE